MSKVDKYLNKTKTEGMDVLEKLEIENLLQETLEYIDDEELSEKAIEAAGWGKDSVAKFGKTIGKNPKEEGFFDACVARMSPKKGWDKEKANGFCARLIDTAKGTTKWRGKNVKESVDKKLFALGRKVSDSLPVGSGMKPNKEQLKVAAKKLGISLSQARKAYDEFRSN